MQDIIDRHDHIALQLSGGRDSIACLYLLRPYLERITVYWLNPGAPFPETLRVMEELKQVTPDFVEIPSDVETVHREHGWPSDIVPVDNTPIGLMASGRGHLLQDRYSCCYRTIMMPMQQRMIDDGITLIIRGQREADKLKAPIRSGHVENGVEFWFPIEDWSDDEVMAFLEKEAAPVPHFYSEGMALTPDCMSCTAWWDEGRAAYLKKHHPEQYRVYQERLSTIRDDISDHIGNFYREVEG